MERLNIVRRLITAFVVVALVATAFILLTGDGEKRFVTASFPRTVALYEGSEVRILGVKVGKVEEVTPAGTSVKVKLSYDAKYKVPADAQAVLVSPAIVGDRFLQLAPVYTSGPVLPDNAVLGVDRTAVPLELDQIYQSINDLTVALGPEGANKGGALTNLLDTTASNFAGQGVQFRETIRNLGKLTGTLANNKDELFGTVTEVERFVKALADNDQTVRDFNDSLAAASGVLEGERDELAAALRNLGVAMKQVSGFVQENRGALSKNIKGLNRISKILVKQRGAIDEILKVAPQALTNLYHTYNNKTGTLDSRVNLAETFTSVITRPDVALCSILGQVDKSGELCKLLNGAAGRAAAFNKPGRPKAVIVVEPIDRTLGGLVAPEVAR